jgi:hypothetical protein
MGKCVYCQERKGKRRCPAFDGMICPSCCGEHRLVRIHCPPDCVFLEKGEVYQEERRFERSRTHGREYLAERAKQFSDEPEFAFALAFDGSLFLAYRSDPGLSDRDVATALESLATQLGRLVVVEAAPNPLAEHLRNVVEKDPDFEHARSWPDDKKRAIVRTIAASVERFAVSNPRGRGYFEFVSRYFREVLRESALGEPGDGESGHVETPPGAGRIVLP